MSKVRLSLRTLTFLIFTLAVGMVAQAQATRTWVSGVGDDVNPCSRTAPCKTFAGAISKTAAGGEINALDPGGYGALTITKAITIDGGPTLASVLAAGTNGFIVNAGANDRVTIRRVTINGATTGINGIRYLAGQTLHLDNVHIFKFRSASGGRGVDVNMTSAGQVFMNDVTIRDCLSDGIRLTSTVVPLLATMNRVQVEKCANGIVVADRSRATIRDSVISTNSGVGVLTQTPTNDAETNIENTILVYNGIGVQAGTGGSNVKVRISNLFVSGGGTGLFNNGGTLTSFGNNSVFGNATDVTGAVGTQPQI